MIPNCLTSSDLGETITSVFLGFQIFQIACFLSLVCSRSGVSVTNAQVHACWRFQTSILGPIGVAFCAVSFHARSLTRCACINRVLRLLCLPLFSITTHGVYMFNSQALTTLVMRTQGSPQLWLMFPMPDLKKHFCSDLVISMQQSWRRTAMSHPGTTEVSEDVCERSFRGRCTGAALKRQRFPESLMLVMVCGT